MSGSISTSATWQPFGNADGIGSSVTCLTSSEFGTPSGSFSPPRSLSASSMMPIERSVPAMVKRPSRELDVARRGFEHEARDLLALLDHFVGAFDDRGAARIHRARAAGAAAGEQLVAVALQQLDALERHAEPRGQHLRERRGVTLAVVERAGDDGDVAVRPRSGCRPSPCSAAR